MADDHGDKGRTSIPTSEYTALRKDKTDAEDMRAQLKDIELLLVAACKCGFVNKNQEDALMFALGKIHPSLDRGVLEVLINIPPKGWLRGNRNDDPDPGDVSDFCL